MIERVEIDCDEDGFHLILEGDLSEAIFAVVGGKRLSVASPAKLNVRLSQDAALQLRAEVREKIEEWAATHDEVKADFERYQRTGERPDYAPPVCTCDPGLSAAFMEGCPVHDAGEGEPGRLGEHLLEGRAVEQHQEDKHGA